MKRILCGAAALLCAAAVAAPAAGIEKVRITAAKKTESQRRGAEQTVGTARGNTKQSDLFYRFEIQRIAVDVPENLVCEYLVAVKTAAGVLYPGATKSEEFVLTGAQPAVIDTETIPLKSVEWQNAGIGRGGGRIAEDIDGWVVRVRDEKGNLVAEKAQPKDLGEKWDAIIAEGRKREGLKNLLEGKIPAAGGGDRSVVVPPRVLRPAPRPAPRGGVRR